MQITHDQVRTLAQPIIAAFPARAARFLRETYPSLAQRIEPAAFDAFVAHGQPRARACGFTSENQIVQYLQVMIHLGPRFDEDPKLGTLRPFLDPASTMSPSWRLHVLLAAARRHQPDPGARRA